MRTKAIGMFFTHYITLRENTFPNPSTKEPWLREPIKLPREHAAVLHYKISNEISGSIYGATLPIDLTECSRNCLRSDHIKNGLNATKIFDRMTRYLVPTLEKRFVGELREGETERQSVRINVRKKR